MFDQPLRLTKPGIFITGTDTGVGKTVVACALAAAIRRAKPELRIGVCKPFATGCRRDREGLVNEDAEALAHFADCRLPLDVINPVRFAQPLAPAVAASLEHTNADVAAIARSLRELDQHSDLLIVEGVGGVEVPIDPQRPEITVKHMIASIGYPAMIVARPNLGTLNHTALTVGALRNARCMLGPIVLNGYDADAAKQDPSMADNGKWISKQCGVPAPWIVPRGRALAVQVNQGVLDGDLIEALTLMNPIKAFANSTPTHTA